MVLSSKRPKINNHPSPPHYQDKSGSHHPLGTISYTAVGAQFKTLNDNFKKGVAKWLLSLGEYSLSIKHHMINALVMNTLIF